MKEQSIAILTYNVKHRKTYDTLALLKAKGYGDVVVYAQPMTYTKKRQPVVKHRPEMIMDIPEPDILCRNLGYTYIEGKFINTIEESDDTIFLLCGAGLLPVNFVLSHRIINSHPGYIPLARGLDSYKWSIYNSLPIGVTTHFLGDYVDGGEVIERREIEVGEFDTFHSVARRVYENEIDMLVGAIEKVDEEHEIIIPGKDSILFKRMPDGKEREIFSRFEDYKTSYRRRDITMIDEFFVRNIEKKEEYLQDEHKLVIKEIYQNAVKQNCVKEFDFIPNITQCMTFTDIKNATGLGIQVLLTCLTDLESFGFIVNVMRNTYKENAYAMVWLGLKYMEMECEAP